MNVGKDSSTMGSRINTLLDTLKQEEALEALQESENRYKQLLESLPAAVYTCDAQGFIQMYNNASVELWGREPHVGKDLWCGSWKIFKTDGTPLSLDSCPMAIALKEGRAVIGEEIIIERPDGMRYNVAPHPRPIFDRHGKVMGAVNMLVNITEHRKREQLILTTEARLRMAVESAELGSWEYDPNENSINCDNRTKKIYWLKGDETITLETALTAIIKSDRARVSESIRKALLPGSDGNLDVDYTIFNYRPKEQRTVRAKGKVFFDKKGLPFRFIGTIVDITEQTRAKEELERLVTKKTKELRDSNVKLEKSNHELEQFAYIASHDLQEPLRKIQTFSTILERNINDLSVVKTYLAKINFSADRMATLIKDVLNYSQLSKKHEKVIDVDLNKVLQDIKNDFELVISDKKVNLIIGPLPTVRGVHHQLHQLFSNLISNSLKFNSENPIIEIASRVLVLQELLDYNIRSKKEYVEIIVKDNGIGFEQKYADKIFVIFQRLNNRDSFTGTGIGLALCKKIVDNHHGSISATSELGTGSIFKIVLPI